MNEPLSSKNRLALLEKCAALLWDAQDMMNDGPDESDVGYAQGKLAEAVEVAREIHRLAVETSPALVVPPSHPLAGEPGFVVNQPIQPCAYCLGDPECPYCHGEPP